MRFGNSFHSLGADARKNLSPYIAGWLLGTIKSDARCAIVRAVTQILVSPTKLVFSGQVITAVTLVRLREIFLINRHYVRSEIQVVL